MATKLKKRKETQKRSKERTLLERSERQNTILKTVCFFLIAIVIAMFVIATTGSNPNILNYENALINKYAEWEQELRERELKVLEYENMYGIEHGSVTSEEP